MTGRSSSLAACLAGGFLAISPVIGWLVAADTPRPRAVILATTADGHKFVAGQGDTCLEAWTGAVLPDVPADIVCRFEF